MATKRGVQAAALLCLVLLPRAALGNCRDDCISSCYSWPFICQMSCASACFGEVGISTLSTTAEGAAPPPPPPPDPAAPAPQQQPASSWVASRGGLKPSAANGDAGDAPTN
ncbi:hypothetical protein HU200_030249 [Digitaria exilis]|uniref:Uncharacterized protein n=1 Tax=Digitaria exilis TaxID=1010633 RepID=A0A835ERJ2_9POAL|nr:hypothetical protein HU200_030249 [Digitaria exilis]CAB3497380.1 unnamed protein product [Digitaria exilis]